MFRVPEAARITLGNLPDPGAAPLATRPGSLFGAFVVAGPYGYALVCIADNGALWRAVGLKGCAWEHVSVRVADGARCPTWDEMCFVKSTFWEPEDCVVQYHPPESDYVDVNKYVLHLWRAVGVELPRPDSRAV